MRQTLDRGWSSWVPIVVMRARDFSIDWTDVREAWRPLSGPRGGEDVGYRAHLAAEQTGCFIYIV